MNALATYLDARVAGPDDGSILDRVANSSFRPHKRLLDHVARVIRNEPACSTADCHAHPESVTVLGVLDVAYSLDSFDARESGDLFVVVGLTAALAIVIFIAVTLVVNRLVYQPPEDLEAGARLVSAGNRSHLIPVRRYDEIGHLAESFNRMTLALERSCSMA